MFSLFLPVLFFLTFTPMFYYLLQIADSTGKGRGVFAAEDIPAGETIEVAPVVVMSAEDRLLLDKTLLHDYIFLWGKSQQQCAMALGYVPVYNHSFKANAEYFMDYDAETISIVAVRDILSGEEVCINYNGDWDDTQPLWFDPKP